MNDVEVKQHPDLAVECVPGAVPIALEYFRTSSSGCARQLHEETPALNQSNK